jgi:heme-degrading monooxygenase HmoA
MIASYHLVHYRNRKFRQNNVPRVDGLNFWRHLSTGPDFTALKPDFTRFTLSRPDFTRWAFFGVWQTEAALNVFLESAPLTQEWKRQAVEVWHVWLKPIRSAGTWHGKNPVEQFDPPDRSNCPVVALTRGDVRLSKLRAFWWSSTYPAISDVLKAPGFISGIAMTERPFMEVATCTVWQSLNDATSFALKRPAHQELIARNQREGIMKAFFSAYFYAYRSAGTWRGNDPVSRIHDM